MINYERWWGESLKKKTKKWFQPEQENITISKMWKFLTNTDTDHILKRYVSKSTTHYRGYNTVKINWYDKLCFYV